MGAYRERKLALRNLEQLTSDPSNVLCVHYSQSRVFDDEYEEISPIITTIVIKSLDGRIEQHYSIYFEADKADIPLDDIQDSYRELEFQILKSFNDFVKRHSQHIWVHWDMKNIKFGFEAIKHRFEKLFTGLKERYEEIPINKKVNLCSMLEGMFGENFTSGPDKLASLMRDNNNGVLDHNYLTTVDEETEFENKNFQSILNSLDCKVNFLVKGVRLLKNKKLKIPNKNNYAVFIDLVTHPIITFIGWLATVIALILTIYTLFAH